MRTPPGDGKLAKSGATKPNPARVAACRSLFGFWRNAVMGNLGARTPLDPAIAGYFFTEAPAGGDKPEPIPLGAVRRQLLALVDRAELTDGERSALHLYHGLYGLPLPFSSERSEPDLAAGRDESSPRSTVRAALAKVADGLQPRFCDGAPPRRPAVDPLLTPWFRDQPMTAIQRRKLVARAYIRASAVCDGPHAVPTLDGLARWYRTCGIADPDLLEARAGDRVRPNRNVLARAAALMEITLFGEVQRYRLAAASAGSSARSAARPRPGPATDGRPDPDGRLELVTHPDLVALLQGDPSPDGLVAAAITLKNRALDGQPVGGPMALLLRCARPQIAVLPKPTLERLAAAISYVAVVDGNPFLALEWFRHLSDHVGVTDRTFTLLVNCSEAASEGGYHGLADRIDKLWAGSLADWTIPSHQIPQVEYTEAEQQRLVAAAYRLERIGSWQRQIGDHQRAADSLRRSIQLATRSVAMAERVLTDTTTFPSIELPDKAGRHGGDLTWPWMLGAVLRITEPLDKLASLAREHPGGRERELADLIDRTARGARAALHRYEGPFEHTYYRDWYDRIDRQTAELSGV